MTPKQLKEWRDVERILKIAGKWGASEIETEKDSLWANIEAACYHIHTEITKEPQ